MSATLLRANAHFQLPLCAVLTYPWTGDNIASALQRDETSIELSDQSALTSKRAVIVEDEGVTQLQLRRSLTRMGMIVAGVANTGESGVAAVLRERPDLVLMDIRMPGEIDGLEAARRILTEYRVCIVMLTAYTLEEYRKLATEIGICGYILKPVVSEMLQVELEKALKSFRQLL